MSVNKLELIKLYKKQECLWNKTIGTGRDRDEAYRSMIQDLNVPELTVTNLKAKIASLRKTYFNELTKVIASKSVDPDNVYKPRLYWFKEAEFLRDYMKKSHFKIKDLPIKNHTEKENLAEKSPGTENEVFQARNLSVKIKKIPDANSTPINDIKRNRKALKRPHNREAVGPSKRFRPTSQNEFDVFCESLAIQLKNMPLQRALVCQQKLQNVMTEERLFQSYDVMLTETNASPEQSYYSPDESGTHQSVHSEKNECDEEFENNLSKCLPLDVIIKDEPELSINTSNTKT